MGLFLQTAIIQNCDETKARDALAKAAKQNAAFELVLEECHFKEMNSGVNILFNENCAGFDELAQSISREIMKPVLLLYIYDEDFWGYYFYENDTQIDYFQPMPDYFEEADKAEAAKAAGDAVLLSKYFSVPEDSIVKYLGIWSEEMLDAYDEKAYEEDEFGQCDCWQMTDFMNKLGYPYEW